MCENSFTENLVLYQMYSSNKHCTLLTAKKVDKSGNFMSDMTNGYCLLRAIKGRHNNVEQSNPVDCLTGHFFRIADQ